MRNLDLLFPELQRNGNLTIQEEELFRKLFVKKHGFDPIHASYQNTTWIISTWKSNEVPELKEIQRQSEERFSQNPDYHDSKQFDLLCKLFDECRNTNRNTVIRPVNLPLLKDNILTSEGMNNYGKSRTGETSDTNAYLNIGTGTTAEAEADHTTYSGSLQTEKARLVMGSRAAVLTQERYSAAFDDGDVTGEPLSITEAGINTAASSGKQIARVVFAAQTLDTGYTMAFQALVNHRNGAAS